MLHSGGRVLEDVRRVHNDRGLKETLKMKRMPIAESIGKWITRHGLQGGYGIESINRTLLKFYGIRERIYKASLE